jgi:hypothetical protein
MCLRLWTYSSHQTWKNVKPLLFEMLFILFFVSSRILLLLLFKETGSCYLAQVGVAGTPGAYHPAWFS